MGLIAFVPPAGASPGNSTDACDIRQADKLRAIETARRCQVKVQIAEATTELDVSWALPNGTIQLEHNYRPVRVQEDGNWQPVDTSLEFRQDGTVAPKAAAADFVFSPGGTAVMATVGVEAGAETPAQEDAALDVDIYSPVGELPRPELSGDTATYKDVLPEVDLRLTADVDGFSQVLVVKTPNAAKNPALRKLSFRIEGDSSRVNTDQHGNTRVTGQDGTTLLESSAPLMWDAAFADERHEKTEASHPTNFGAEAKMPTSVSGDVLSVQPAQDVLSNRATTFPVYIDPGYTMPRRSWAYTNSATPNSTYWNGSGRALIGTPNAGATKYRSYFVMNADNEEWYGKPLLSATLSVSVAYSASCTTTEFGVYSLARQITNPLSWNNQPGLGQKLDSIKTNMGGNGCPSAGTANFNILPLARTAQTNQHTNVDVVIAATSETDTRYYKEIGNNPKLDIIYDDPARLTYIAIDSTNACGSGSTRTQVFTSTPRLKATFTDAEASNLDLTFEYQTPAGALLGSEVVAGVPRGQQASVLVTDNTLTSGQTYQWRVGGYDGRTTSWTIWCEFVVHSIIAGPDGTEDTAYIIDDAPDTVTTYPDVEETQPAGDEFIDGVSNGPDISGPTTGTEVPVEETDVDESDLPEEDGTTVSSAEDEPTTFIDDPVPYSATSTQASVAATEEECPNSTGTFCEEPGTEEQYAAEVARMNASPNIDGAGAVSALGVPFPTSVPDDCRKSQPGTQVLTRFRMCRWAIANYVATLDTRPPTVIAFVTVKVTTITWSHRSQGEWDMRVLLEVLNVQGNAYGVAGYGSSADCSAKNCLPYFSPKAFMLSYVGARGEFAATYKVNLAPNTAMKMAGRIQYKVMRSDLRPPPSTSAFSNEIRCDWALRGSTTRGCINPGFSPTLTYSRAEFPELAAHISAAQKSGLAGSHTVGRLTRNGRTADIAANRARACPQSLRTKYSIPAIYTCDEYPFASTYQGAATSGASNPRVFNGCHLPRDINSGPNGYSRCFINGVQNRVGGARLGAFYGNLFTPGNRVLHQDKFYVEIGP